METLLGGLSKPRKRNQTTQERTKGKEGNRWGNVPDLKKNWTNRTLFVDFTLLIIYK